MEPLITILLGVIGSLLAAEIWANAPRLGRWFIKRAIHLLPASKRDHYHEEWLSHLEEFPGAIAKLRHALGCYFRAAGELAAREKLTPEAEKAVVKFMIKIIARIMFLPQALPLIIHGKFNNLRVAWKVTEFMMYGIYILRNKFGGTDADVKAIVARCTRNLSIHAEKSTFEIAKATLEDISEAILEVKKRRRHGAE